MKTGILCYLECGVYIITLKKIIKVNLVSGEKKKTREKKNVLFYPSSIL